MRRLTLVLIGCLIAILALSLDPPRSAAQAGDPWSLIAEVNALRASYGLAPYEVNDALMAAAQSHSEYQMQAGSVTHSGPGGSRPHDRAVAFGYGGGAQAYVSENIAMGIQLSPQGAVYDMWQDALHLETMISSRYQEIGAGVAVSGDYFYYTIDVGYVAGSSNGSSSSVNAQPPPGTPLPTIAIIQPVQVATANPDGSVIHVVGEGQALLHIADAYKIPLPDLLALNGLTESSIIYPGDKLVIQPPEPTPLASPTPTPGEATPRPTRTPKPSLTPTLKRPTDTPTSVTGTPLAALNSTPQAPADSKIVSQALVANPNSGPDYLLIIIGVLGAAGVGLILLGSMLKRSG